MEENQSIEKKRKNSSPPRGGPKKRLTVSFEEKLRAVKLHLEEGFPQELVAQELGVSSAAVYKWTHRYRLQGEEALKPCVAATRNPKLAEAVRQKIVELKKEEPARGIKRISQILRRVFFLQPVRRRSGGHSRSKGWSSHHLNPDAIWCGLVSLSERRPTRCGRQTSSPSDWAVGMRI